MLASVMSVYELLDAPQNFAFFVHGRGHSVEHESRELIYGWLDANLQKPADDRPDNATGWRSGDTSRPA